MLTQTNSHEAFQFIGFLTEALPAVDQVTPTQINYGGCGVFAENLYENLVSLGYEPQIIALYAKDNAKISASARKSLKEFVANGNGISNAGQDHVVIRLNDIYMDSTGIISTGQVVATAIELVELTIDQLKELNLKGKWNPIFDRSLGDFIKDKMASFFNMYKEDKYTPGIIFNSIPEETKLNSYTLKMIRKFREESNPLEALFRGFENARR